MAPAAGINTFTLPFLPGRRQANLTGLRLQQIGHKYLSATHSPLDRAVETAGLVLAHFPGVPTRVDAILEEGGPVPPDPTINYWSLPKRVRIIVTYRKGYVSGLGGDVVVVVVVVVAVAVVVVSKDLFNVEYNVIQNITITPCLDYK